MNTEKLFPGSGPEEDDDIVYAEGELFEEIYAEDPASGNIVTDRTGLEYAYAAESAPAELIIEVSETGEFTIGEPPAEDPSLVDYLRADNHAGNYHAEDFLLEGAPEAEFADPEAAAEEELSEIEAMPDEEFADMPESGDEYADGQEAAGWIPEPADETEPAEEAAPAEEAQAQTPGGEAPGQDRAGQEDYADSARDQEEDTEARYGADEIDVQDQAEDIEAGNEAGDAAEEKSESDSSQAPVDDGPHPENVTVVGVRFRGAGKVYFFDPKGMEVKRGDHVIVETSRGVEYGYAAGRPMVVPYKKITQPLRPVLRVATQDDLERNAANRAREKTALRACRQKVADRGLEMKLIDAEYTFDNSKILFYFTADGRVDFRELVKDLAGIFHTRIELRQIGVRDETRILGGYGICGRPLCCHTWLNDFVPVSIKMAKEQNLSLNPGKISGVCGRLMCCLKNETETYEELNKNLPRPGDEVEGRDGLRGQVESVNVLRQTVRILVEVDDEKEFHEYGVEDITILRRRKKGMARRGGLPQSVPMEKPEKPEKQERQGKQDKADRQDKSEKQDKSDRQERKDRQDRPERQDRQDRQERPDRQDRQDRQDKSDRQDQSANRNARRRGRRPDDANAPKQGDEMTSNPRRQDDEMPANARRQGDEEPANAKRQGDEAADGRKSSDDTRPDNRKFRRHRRREPRESSE